MLDLDDARAAWFGGLRPAGPAALLCAVGSGALAAQGVETMIVLLFRMLAALTLPCMAVTLWLENRARAAPRASATAASGPTGRAAE